MGFTLVDLHGGYDRELHRLAERAGRHMMLDDVRAVLERVWQEQADRDATATWEPTLAADEAMWLDLDRRTCLGLGLDDPQVHAEAHAIARRTFGNAATYQVYPEAFQTLQALRKRGLTLGIISNWGWWLPELCGTLGLAPYFDFIVSSARVGAAKPHPAIFREALARAGSDPACTLHVGDSLTADVFGARTVGITGVLLDRRGTSSAGAGGYPTIGSLDQLLDLL